MATALYPGAFKPPHRGHFDVVKSLLNNTHNGKVYSIDTIDNTIDSLTSGETEQVEKINKVVVFVGAKERNGISGKESKKVWEVYSKYLPGVDIKVVNTNPMLAAKDYAKANPEEKFYAITGFRDESDKGDLRRVTTFKNRDNVEGLAVASKEDNPTRATDFRKALMSGNLDEIIDFFPSELSRNEILQIVEILKQSIISEMMNEDIENLFNSWFSLDEGSSGTPVAPSSTLRSDDRAKLVRVYNQLLDVIGDSYYNIHFNQDHIRISIKGEKPTFDFTPYMGSILEYMIDEGMNIQPLPEVKIKQDIAEASDFFGRTAYYDPNSRTVMLYTQGRHPKDIMRSFTHEMIHHMQNIEGRLGKITTSNTNESNSLLEIEKEAYLLGNITFRNWEDKNKTSK